VIEIFYDYLSSYSFNFCLNRKYKPKYRLDPSKLSIWTYC